VPVAAPGWLRQAAFRFREAEMRVDTRNLTVLLLGLILASGTWALAQEPGGTEPAVLAANAQPAAKAAPDEPAPTPAPAPRPQAGAGIFDDVGAPAPLIPTTAGPLGLFTLETADMLQKGGWSVAGYADKFSRMPGSVTVANYGLNFGVGLADWLNLFVDFDPHRHTHVSQPSQLSLRSPLANPVFPNTIFRTVAPANTPAYVEDFPFAANNGGGVGELTIGVKLGLLSETSGQPFSLSLRNDFIIPTRASLANLLGNGTQSGEFNDLLSMAISRNWSNAVTLGFNFGARFTRDPNDGGTHLLSQANQLRMGAGFILLPRSRVQFMNEYTGIVFVGDSTPNQSFGARDPVDGVWGVRLYPTDNFAVDLGYRYMLNLGNAQDRNGFVIKAGYARQPAPPPPPNRQPMASCSVNPATIFTGSTDPVMVNVNASDPDGDALAYSWTASGGSIQGSGAQVTWMIGGLAPGNYRATVNISDNRGGTISCTADLRVDPRPNRPPTAMLSADRTTVLVGERVGFTANCMDPDGDPLTYTWTTNGGQIVGTGAAVQLDTTGLAPGSYTVTVRCEDGRGGAADASATVQVQAPPPPPMASKINQCDFSPVNSARVDNVCKRLLDDVALRLQNDPGATVVIVGFADPAERQPATLAGTRATNVVNYLATDRGVNRARLSTRPGTGQAGAGAANRRADIIWVPAGATY
jgi:outer membrane protein OmpA-like peptidoglycan-associated protein